MEHLYCTLHGITKDGAYLILFGVLKEKISYACLHFASD
jgi:hypothetical protein